MATLSMSQVAQVAINAGLPKDKVPTAVAIAFAESRGNTTAHNVVPPDNSYGLWQINMYGSLGPDRRRQFGLTSNDQLFDPATNAKAMMAISHGGSTWRPWTTYTSGRYLGYLSAAKKAIPSSGDTSPPIQTTPVGISDSLGNIATVIKTLTNPQTYVRASYLLIGMLLIGFALVKMTGASKLATKAAQTVMPVGKAAKVLRAVK